jgi:hypothetical protein
MNLINQSIHGEKLSERKTSETWVQFHQRSTRSFCANSLAPLKYKAKMWVQKAARATYICKSCALNVGEIDPWSAFSNESNLSAFQNDTSMLARIDIQLS